MILLLTALAHAADCDPAAALAALPESGAREDYVCVMEADAGKDLIVAAMAKDPTGGHERLTRALALWLLERTDRPMDPAVVDKLAPGDRRLLADGIRARRGRASPAPEHAKIFAQFAWYAPVPTYTDSRLRPIDRENLAVVDPPVRLTPPPAAPAAGEPAPAEPGAAPVTAETPNLCGCSQPGRPWTGLALAGVLAALIRRRP